MTTTDRVEQLHKKHNAEYQALLDLVYANATSTWAVTAILNQVERVIQSATALTVRLEPCDQQAVDAGLP